MQAVDHCLPMLLGLKSSRPPESHTSTSHRGKVGRPCSLSHQQSAEAFLPVRTAHHDFVRRAYPRLKLAIAIACNSVPRMLSEPMPSGREGAFAGQGSQVVNISGSR
eukprot:1157582-Pelagomonas_calceolata.AAC.4